MSPQTSSAGVAPVTTPADTPATPQPAGPEDGPGTGTLVPIAELVDPAHITNRAGEDLWQYVQRGSADLDGDGEEELVIVTARAELVRGVPAWDDGQPWQIYVEEPDGQITHLYAQYVQLGTVLTRITLPPVGDGTATVVLLEHLPDRITLYEASYEGPGRASVRRVFQRNLDPMGELASPDLP